MSINIREYSELSMVHECRERIFRFLHIILFDFMQLNRGEKCRCLKQYICKKKKIIRQIKIYL